MLFDQTLDLQECWEEVPFVLLESQRDDSGFWQKLPTLAVLIGSVKLQTIRKYPSLTYFYALAFCLHKTVRVMRKTTANCQECNASSRFRKLYFILFHDIWLFLERNFGLCPFPLRRVCRRGWSYGWIWSRSFGFGFRLLQKLMELKCVQQGTCILLNRRLQSRRGRRNLNRPTGLLLLGRHLQNVQSGVCGQIQ